MIEVDRINKLCENTMISHLGIRFTEITKEGIKATMPVDSRTRQPMGYLHGGATLAFAETLASVGSYVLLNNDDYLVFGAGVSGQHQKTATDGIVDGIAVNTHWGDTTHCWEVKIYDDKQKLLSSCLVTNVIKRKKV